MLKEHVFFKKYEKKKQYKFWGNIFVDFYPVKKCSFLAVRKAGYTQFFNKDPREKACKANFRKVVFGRNRLVVFKVRLIWKWISPVTCLHETLGLYIVFRTAFLYGNFSMATVTSFFRGTWGFLAFCANSIHLRGELGKVAWWVTIGRFWFKHH